MKDGKSPFALTGRMSAWRTRPVCGNAARCRRYDTLRDLAPGETDRRTGKVVSATYADWTTHPNNPVRSNSTAPPLKEPAQHTPLRHAFAKRQHNKTPMGVTGLAKNQIPAASTIASNLPGNPTHPIPLGAVHELLC